MKAVWKYTLARLAVFLVTYAVVWAIANAQWKVAVIDPFVLLAAIIVSGVISLFALRGLRDDIVRRLELRAAHKVARSELTREPGDLD
ncbi:MAG: DUF4229 domain-containing protein [Aeromicrobium sp.]